MNSYSFAIESCLNEDHCSGLIFRLSGCNTSIHSKTNHRWKEIGKDEWDLLDCYTIPINVRTSHVAYSANPFLGNGEAELQPI